MMSIRRRTALLGALAAPLAARTALAADYPTRPIRLIVPYAPGGGADAVARIIAKLAGDSMGQSIVVENKGGAGSIVGTDLVAKAAPDGYTLLLGQSGPISINPAVYKTLPYDPVKELVPISMTNSYPYVLVINGKTAAKDLAAFVALAKEKAGGFNYGTTGVGAANQLMAELFCDKAGVKMTHIPYRGTALAVADCVANNVTMVFGDPVSVLPHVNSGSLRALAVSSPQRSPVQPTVPTMAESGYPGVEAVAWHGIFAPAKTPQEIIDKLNTEIVKALKNPEIVDLLNKQAMSPVGGTQAEFAAFLKKDVATWKDVATMAKVSVE
ncbi:MAG: tripartite tricarboxylate transporter substrate binding protein [Reyranella sp.]|uniref:Bug family tripartite tricarboxylate transporter substrate binding protein n=1 Tax=Reyranella sp. TaxID=1929291 RepID=UPI001ACA7972|nr:tripartite tricarboxylate transporter substrate binding protein [Reyranella sp.]MBN9089209.1 tripartite tricarboxylate transporter substrate binding protein [Reyranella sp.]